MTDEDAAVGHLTRIAYQLMAGNKIKQSSLVSICYLHLVNIILIELHQNNSKEKTSYAHLLNRITCNIYLYTSQIHVF